MYLISERGIQIQRILQRFYRPKLHNDVAEFCHTLFFHTYSQCALVSAMHIHSMLLPNPWICDIAVHGRQQACLLLHFQSHMSISNLLVRSWQKRLYICTNTAISLAKLPCIHTYIRTYTLKQCYWGRASTYVSSISVYRVHAPFPEHGGESMERCNLFWGWYCVRQD